MKDSPLDIRPAAWVPAIDGRQQHQKLQSNHLPLCSAISGAVFGCWLFTGERGDIFEIQTSLSRYQAYSVKVCHGHLWHGNRRSIVHRASLASVICSFQTGFGCWLFRQQPTGKNCKGCDSLDKYHLSRGQASSIQVCYSRP